MRVLQNLEYCYKLFVVSHHVSFTNFRLCDALFCSMKFINVFLDLLCSWFISFASLFKFVDVEIICSRRLVKHMVRTWPQYRNSDIFRTHTYLSHIASHRSCAFQQNHQDKTNFFLLPMTKLTGMFCCYEKWVTITTNKWSKLFTFCYD